MFAKMTGCVETWQSSFLIRARQWSQCLVTCWSNGSSQCLCILMLFETFLEAFETHLGMNRGYFPILEETDPWSALKFASWLYHIWASGKIYEIFLSSFFFARKAPDVAILQITGTFFNSGAGCRSSGMNDGGDLSQFLECIYTMHFFIDIHIYIYIHMHLIYVERGRKKTYIESNSWCVVCRSKIRIPSKDCLKLVTGPVRNDNAFSRVPWKIYDWLEPPKLHTSACLQVNLNQW